MSFLTFYSGVNGNEVHNHFCNFLYPVKVLFIDNLKAQFIIFHQNSSMPPPSKMPTEGPWQ